MESQVVLVTLSVREIPEITEDCTEINVGGAPQFSYNTDIMDIKIGDFVNVDYQGGIKVGMVTKVLGLSQHQLSKATEWIIGKIDMIAHIERKKRAQRAQELRNRLEEKLAQRNRRKAFEEMAQEDESVKELLNEFLDLGGAKLLEQPNEMKSATEETTF